MSLARHGSFGLEYLQWGKIQPEEKVMKQPELGWKSVVAVFRGPAGPGSPDLDRDLWGYPLPAEYQICLLL
jgi:hypothetical protein